MSVISRRTVGVHAHLARRDVGGDTEIRQPQVLDLLVLKHVLDAMVEGATCQSTRVHVRTARTVYTEQETESPLVGAHAQ